MESWRVRYASTEGQIRSTSGFISERLALDYAADLRAHQRRGDWVDPTAGQLTMAEWYRTWLPTVTASERTVENYGRNLRVHVLPRGGVRSHSPRSPRAT